MVISSERGKVNEVAELHGYANPCLNLTRVCLTVNSNTLAKYRFRELQELRIQGIRV